MDTSPHISDFVSVNGIRLHYLDWGGGGSTLLFLAGWGCNAHIFDGFAQQFADQFHALALTRRGHGESDYPETSYDINTLTDDIRLFLDALKIDKIFLIGHSLAGIELSHFAVQYPDRVLGLVYLDAAYDRSSAESKEISEKWPAKDIEEPPDNGVYDSISDLAAHYRRYSPSFAAIWNEAMDEDLRHQVTFSPEGKVIYKGTAGIGKAILETLSTYQPEYAKIRVPVLNIYAIKDNTYYLTPLMTKEKRAEVMEFFDNVVQRWNRHCIEQFRRDVPHAKIVEIPHSHHYVFLKDEEQVCKEMKMFFLNCQGSS